MIKWQRLKLALQALRKKTTPVHILAGFVTVLAGVYIGVWLAILLFIAFLLIQIWSKKEWETSQNDFWEYVCSIFIITGILLLAMLVLK